MCVARTGARGPPSGPRPGRGARRVDGRSRLFLVATPDPPRRRATPAATAAAGATTPRTTGPSSASTTTAGTTTPATTAATTTTAATVPPRAGPWRRRRTEPRRKPSSFGVFAGLAGRLLRPARLPGGAGAGGRRPALGPARPAAHRRAAPGDRPPRDRAAGDRDRAGSWPPIPRRRTTQPRSSAPAPAPAAPAPAARARVCAPVTTGSS